MSRKLIVKIPKPRNPWVAASYRSAAGVHRTTPSGARQMAQRSLRRELHHLEHERHSP